jgi:4-hydroxy-3-methylbut-2-en-1-yl diphosphate synthase IspG/GcpE
MDGSVVITSVKIIYHMNTVGCDVLRVSCPNDIENLTLNVKFQQG